MKIEETKVDEFYEKVKELENMLTERIEDCYEVRGMMQCRHAYILYRKLLWEAKEIINDNLKEK